MKTIFDFFKQPQPQVPYSGKMAGADAMGPVGRAMSQWGDVQPSGKFAGADAMPEPQGQGWASGIGDFIKDYAQFRLEQRVSPYQDLFSGNFRNASQGFGRRSS